VPSESASTLDLAALEENRRDHCGSDRNKKDGKEMAKGALRPMAVFGSALDGARRITAMKISKVSSKNHGCKRGNSVSEDLGSPPGAAAIWTGCRSQSLQI
jgi:hypothetical protein